MIRRTKKTFFSGRHRAWFLLIAIYLTGKIISSPAPLIYLQQGELKSGFFNYKNIPDHNGAVNFALPPWQLSSAYATSLDDARLTGWGAMNEAGNKIYLFGTDQVGRDQFAGFMNGFEIALLTGFGTALLSGMIAVFIALLAAYFTRFKIRIPAYGAIIFVLFLLVFLFCLGWWILGIIPGWVVLTILLLISLCAYLLISFVFKKGPFTLPLQHGARALYNFIFPVPDIILLAIISTQVQSGGIWILVVILAFFRIPAGAVYLQGATDTMVNEPYIIQARGMGLSHMRVMWRHLFPGLRQQLSMWMGLTAGRAILAESALSFLGIGPTAGLITWGSMINNALHQPVYYAVGLVCLAGILIIQLLFRRLF